MINKNSKIGITKEVEKKLIETAQDLILWFTYSVLLASEMHYMVTNNVNTEDGLTNGVIGILKKYDEESQTVWMFFEDDRVGKKARNQVSQFMKDNNIPSVWTPIRKIVRPLMVYM